MPTTLIRTITVATAIAVTFAVAAPAEAQNKCDSAKLKCMSKKALCLLKVHEKAIKKGELADSEKLDKCKAKFDGPAKGCVAKVEGKQNGEKPESVCTVSGNTLDMETIVDDFVALALSGIQTGGVPNSTPTPPSTATPVSTPTPVVCGAFNDPTCGGNCPANEVCTGGGSGICSCVPECFRVDIGCVGSCGVSGGACGCDDGFCVEGFCSSQGDCPAGFCFQGVCVGATCALDADCVSGLCNCSGSCMCQ